MTGMLRASKLAKKLNISTDELSEAFGVDLHPNQKIYSFQDDMIIIKSNDTTFDELLGYRNQLNDILREHLETLTAKVNS